MKIAHVFIVTLAVLAGPAAAQEHAKRLGCYQKVMVPAQYHVTKTKISDSHRAYVQRNGRYELMEYPAVYQEHRKLVKEAYYVMKEISCNTPPVTVVTK